MKHIIFTFALLLIFITTSHPQGGIWSKLSSLGQVVSTGGGDTLTVGCYAITADGKVYKAPNWGWEWNLCVTLPPGLNIKDSAPSHDNPCVIFVFTHDKAVYKVNLCNCTYTYESTLPSSMGMLSDMAWKNTTTSWAVGDQGSIFRSTDSGLNWGIQNSGVQTYLSDVEVPERDTDVVAAVGDGGKFIKSTNGGNNWEQVNLGSTEYLSKFSFVNTTPLQGLISGSNGVLYVLNNNLTSKTVITTNTELGFNSYTNLPKQAGQTAKGVNVMDNGSYTFLYETLPSSPPIYTISPIYVIPGASQDYLMGVSGGVRKMATEDALDSLIILVVGASGNLYRYSEGLIASDEKEPDLIPYKTALMQNYPNPFNPKTKIRYEIARGGEMSLRVFDVLGNEVRELVNEKQEAGSYEVDFDSRGLASGIYYYQLRTENFQGTKKLVVVK